MIGFAYFPKISDVFLNGPTPASFRLFSVFSNKHYKILQQIDVKKCPSSLRCRDSNPRRLEFESLPITTRPGLPPKSTSVYSVNCLKSTKINEKDAGDGSLKIFLKQIGHHVDAGRKTKRLVN